MAIPNPKWQPGTGSQVILKSDFVDIEQAIITQPGVRMQPPLVWVDATTVRVEATADCLAQMALTGMPNILNPSVQVDGDLSDGIIRSISANISMIITAGGIWGTEKVSQWYAVFAIAADADTVFTLKSMPIMRVKSQASQVISLGTLPTPATGIGYGFTTDEHVGGMVYFLSGDSKGLMRAIAANNNDNVTGGTITYGGAALTVAAGDWFIVLPSTNFRWVGSFFNNSGGNIQPFIRQGDRVELSVWTAFGSAGTHGTADSDISVCCPLATAVSVEMTAVGDSVIIYNDWGSAAQGYVVGAGTVGVITLPIRFCLYGLVTATSQKTVGYAYPPGCGY